jgi:hypothetical protein
MRFCVAHQIFARAQVSNRVADRTTTDHSCGSYPVRPYI